LSLFWSLAKGKALLDLVERGHRSPVDQPSHSALLHSEESYRDLLAAERAFQFYEGPLPFHVAGQEGGSISYDVFDSAGLERYPVYATREGLSGGAVLYPIGTRALLECAGFFVQLELVAQAFGGDLPQRCKERLSVASGPTALRVIEPRIPDFVVSRILGNKSFYHEVLLACVVLALETLPENFPSAGHMLLEFAEHVKRSRLRRPSPGQLTRWLKRQRSRFSRVVPRAAIIVNLLNLDFPPATAAAHLAMPLDLLLTREPNTLVDKDKYFLALCKMQLPLAPWMDSDTLDVVPGTCEGDSVEAICEYEWDVDVAEQLWNRAHPVCQVVRRGLKKACPQHTRGCGKAGANGALVAHHPACLFRKTTSRFLA